MGWFDNTEPQSFDASQSFNYGSEQDKIKRKRELAAMLLKQSQNSPQGQFIKSGDFTGYAGGAKAGNILASALMGFMSGKTQSHADSDVTALDKNSDARVAYLLDEQNSPWSKEARASQMQKEAADELMRESRRGTQGVPAATEDGAAQMPDTGAAQTAPIRSGSVETTNLPVGSISPSPVNVRAASAALNQPFAGRSRGIGGPTAEQLPQSSVDPLTQRDQLVAERNQTKRALSQWGSRQRQADPEGFNALQSKATSLDQQIFALENAVAPAAGALGQSINSPASAVQPGQLPATQQAAAARALNPAAPAPQPVAPPPVAQPMPEPAQRAPQPVPPGG